MQKNQDHRERNSPRPRVERVRFLNIIYFVDSHRTRSLKFTIKTASFTLFVLFSLLSWSFIASGLLYREYAVNSELRTHSQTLLASLFNYQTRFDEVYERAYPNENLTNLAQNSMEEQAASTNEPKDIETNARFDESHQQAQVASSEGKSKIVPPTQGNVKAMKASISMGSQKTAAIEPLKNPTQQGPIASFSAKASMPAANTSKAKSASSVLSAPALPTNEATASISGTGAAPLQETSHPASNPDSTSKSSPLAQTASPEKIKNPESEDTSTLPENKPTVSITQTSKTQPASAEKLSEVPAASQLPTPVSEESNSGATGSQPESSAMLSAKGASNTDSSKGAGASPISNAKEKIAALAAKSSQVPIVIENFSAFEKGSTLVVHFSLKNLATPNKASGIVSAKARFVDKEEQASMVEMRPSDIEDESASEGADPSSDQLFNIRYYKNKVFRFDRPPQKEGRFNSIIVSIVDDKGRTKDFNFNISPKKSSTPLPTESTQTIEEKGPFASDTPEL